MKGIRLGAIAAAVVVAFGAAGCGGDDDSSDGTTAAALSKEDFLTQGNQICADGNAEIEAASKETFSGGQPTADEVEQFATDTLVPAVQSQVDGISALGAPEGDEDQVAAILDAAQQGIDDLTADPSLITDNSNDPFAEANQLAADYGLTECAG